MTLRRVALLVVGLLVIGISAVSYYLLMQRWAYEGAIVGSYCIDQRFADDIYDIVVCDDDQVIVSDVNAWIVAPGVFYGSYGENNYFLVNTENGDVKLFQWMATLNDFLRAEGYSAYDLNEEENIAHLKYGGAETGSIASRAADTDPALYGAVARVLRSTFQCLSFSEASRFQRCEMNRPQCSATPNLERIGA